MTTQVHRFGDLVALSTGGGPTRYMTVKAARTIARGLYRAARSIETERFADSSVGSITAPDVAHNDISTVKGIAR